MGWTKQGRELSFAPYRRLISRPLNNLKLGTELAMANHQPPLMGQRSRQLSRVAQFGMDQGI